MTKEETIKKLKASQDLPHATPDDFPYIPENITKEEFAEYLKDFLKPTGVCWVCDERLFVQWGLQHGIAFCEGCGVDVKMYHYFEKDGTKKRWERTLQRHPKHYGVHE